ncbi:hypothetical protein NL452_27355, partial [Klebsiella pneumoniae]|nr:hypothetical protein [Klebsiella pneumoniae]
TPPSTGTVMFEFMKNGVQIGTMTFDIAGAVVISFPNTIVFAQGDDLQIVSPLNMSGMRDMFITLSAYR